MITFRAIRELAELRRRHPTPDPRRYLTVEDLETIALLRDLQARIEMGLPPFDKQAPFNRPGRLRGE